MYGGNGDMIRVPYCQKTMQLLKKMELKYPTELGEERTCQKHHALEIIAKIKRLPTIWRYENES